MDKPRHPIVIQPWKIQQTQRTKRNVLQAKLEKERGRLALKAPKILTSPTRQGVSHNAFECSCEPPRPQIHTSHANPHESK